MNLPAARLSLVPSNPIQCHCTELDICMIRVKKCLSQWFQLISRQSRQCSPVGKINYSLSQTRAGEKWRIETAKFQLVGDSLHIWVVISRVYRDLRLSPNLEPLSIPWSKTAFTPPKKQQTVCHKLWVIHRAWNQFATPGAAALSVLLRNQSPRHPLEPALFRAWSLNLKGT